MELLNALLLALPGTPVLYYGDEIGMGDNIYLGDRNGVRTPMQWSSDRNAGFSRANPQRLHLPIIIDPEYHYESVNVEAQQNNLHSLLLWMRRLIALRRRYKAFSRGSIEFLAPSNTHVLAFLRRWGNECLLVVANLSRFVQFVELDLKAFAGQVPIELFGQNPFPRLGDLPYLLTLGPHAFYWFGISATQPAGGAPALSTAQPTGDTTAPAAPPGRPLVRTTGDWRALVLGDERPALETALLAALPAQRWFAGKGAVLKAVTIVDAIPIEEAWLVIARVISVQAADAAHYALPLAFLSGEQATAARHDRPAAVLAELEIAGREGVTTGVCVDACSEPEFGRSLLDTIGRRRRIAAASGHLVGTTTRSFSALRGDAATLPPPTLLGGEQSNSSLRFDDRLMLKVFRRVAEGTNPELEIGRYLTEEAGFPHIAPLAGALEFQRPRGEPVTVAVVQGFVPNEGDAWRYTVDHVEHYLEEVLLHKEPEGAASAPPPAVFDLIDQEPPPIVRELAGGYLEVARSLGLRVAALHLALGRPTENPDFAPEPLGLLYQRSRYQSLRNLVGQVFRMLRDRQRTLPAEIAADVERLLRSEARVLERCQRIVGRRLSGMRIRCHGDLHLGQILRTGNDFLITDFEGEPARSLTERRLKRSPLRDVAGMVRSFDYAAHAALESLRARGVAARQDPARLERWTVLWSRWVGSAFLRAYRHDAEGSGLLPRTREERRTALAILLLEKCVYELGYELGSRPAWVGIPLRGILDLLDQPW
jgi:maltose alpha-D-glucosyltransferase/alpha-amylase